MNPTLLIVAIGVALGGYVGYHRLHAGHAQQAQLITTQIAQEKSDQDAQQRVTALFADIEAYQQRLPQEPDPSWLVSKITEAARIEGIELTSLSPENPVDQKTFVRLSAAFQFQATYHQLGRFLAQLESSRSFIRVDRVEMNPQPMASARAGQPAHEQAAAEASLPAAQPLAVRLKVSTLYVPPVTGQTGKRS